MRQQARSNTLIAIAIVVTCAVFECLMVTKPLAHSTLLALDSAFVTLGTLCAAALAIGPPPWTFPRGATARLQRVPVLCAAAALIFSILTALEALSVPGGQPTSNGSPLDAGYLAIYPVMLAALHLLSPPPSTSIARVRIVLDSALITCALGIASWYFLIGPAILHNRSSVPTLVLSVAYPVGDICVAFAVIRFYLSSYGRQLTRIMLPLAICTTCVLIADSLLTYNLLHDVNSTGTPLDPLWPTGYLIGSLGVRRLRHDLTQGRLRTPSDNLQVPSIWQQTLPYLLIPLAASLTAYAWWHTPPHDTIVVAGVVVGISVLIMLIVARQLITILEHHSLNQQLAQLYQHSLGQAAQLNHLLGTMWAANTTSILSPDRLEDVLNQTCDRLGVVCLAVVLSTPWPGAESDQRTCFRGFATGTPTAQPANPATTAAGLAANALQSQLDPTTGWLLALPIDPETGGQGWLLAGCCLNGEPLSKHDIDVLSGLVAWTTSHLHILQFLQRRTQAEQRLEQIARLRVADNFHAIANRFAGSSHLRETLRQAKRACEHGLPDEAATLIAACDEQFANFERWYRRQYDRYRQLTTNNLYGTLYRIEALARGFAIAYANRLNFEARVASDIDMPQALPEHLSGLLEAIVEEAVHNAVKHGNASQVRVEATRDQTQQRIYLTVTDNGTGIPSHTARAITDGSFHHPVEDHGGITALREEVTAPPLCGTLTIVPLAANGSAPFAHGTQLTCELAIPTYQEGIPTAPTQMAVVAGIL